MQPSQNNIPQDAFLFEEQPFDLRKFFHKYILGWWWLYILGIILALGIAKIYLRYADYFYEVKATLLIKDSGNSGKLTEENIVCILKKSLENL